MGDPIVILGEIFRRDPNLAPLCDERFTAGQRFWRRIAGFFGVKCRPARRGILNSPKFCRGERFNWFEEESYE